MDHCAPACFYCSWVVDIKLQSYLLEIADVRVALVVQMLSSGRHQSCIVTCGLT